MPHYVHLCMLGKCEHCGQIISLEDYAGSEGNETWHCKHCRKPIGHVSFGYDKPGAGCKKVRWIGPKGKWVSKKPTDSFTLGDLAVQVEIGRFPR